MVFPSRNLPTSAEPWGRAVESKLNALDGTATRSIGSLSNLARQVTGTNDTLVGELPNIREGEKAFSISLGALREEISSTFTYVGGFKPEIIPGVDSWEAGMGRPLNTNVVWFNAGYDPAYEPMVWDPDGGVWIPVFDPEVRAALVAVWDRFNTPEGRIEWLTGENGVVAVAIEGSQQIFHSVDDPTGVAKDGAIWFKHGVVDPPVGYVPELSDPVIGQWQFQGDAWFVMEVTSEIIANLDVGKLTAGTAVIDTLVAQSIAASSGEFLTARAEWFAANKIETAWLQADAIDGMTITGATLQTGASNPRIVLNSSGLRAYNTAGTNTFTLATATGNVTATGGSFSASSFSGGTVTGSTIQTSSSSSWGIKMNDPSYPGDFTVYDNAGNLAFRIQDSGDSMPGRVDMLHRLVVGGSQWLGKYSRGIALVPSVSGLNGIFFNEEASTVSGTSAGFYIDGSSVTTLRSHNGGQIYINGGQGGMTTNQGGSYDDTEIWGVGAAIINGMRGGLRTRTFRATTGGTNVVALSTPTGWEISYDGSSERYKSDIQPIGVDPAAILDIDPVWWYDKQNLENYSAWLDAEAAGEEPPVPIGDIQPIKRIPGIIAERVHDAGLYPFVEYMTDPETGLEVPNGVMDRRLWVLLIPLVRDLRARVEELERRLNV